jgi:hypothetical protein
VSRGRRLRAALAFSLVLCGALAHERAVAAAPVIAGATVQVTSAAAGPTRSPNAVRLKDGNIVFVWQGAPTGGEDQPYARILGPDWKPLTTIFRVNVRPEYRGWAPEVVALSTGNFAVAWESRTASSADLQRVKARIFDKLGKPLTGDLTVAMNMYRKNLSEEIVATPAENGGFLVTWPAQIGPFGGADTFNEMQSRLVRAPGAGQGPVVRHAKRYYDNLYPAGARLNNGAIVLTWTADFQDGQSGTGFVYSRFRNASGAFGPINGISPPPQPDVEQVYESEASIAALATGGFAIAWQDRLEATPGDVAVRTFSASGSRGAKLSVNVQKAGVQGQTALAGLRGGGFVVGWVSGYGAPRADQGNIIRVYNARNQPVHAGFKVPGSGHGRPSLATLGGIGEFLLTFPSTDGLKARRYVLQP